VRYAVANAPYTYLDFFINQIGFLYCLCFQETRGKGEGEKGNGILKFSGICENMLGLSQKLMVELSLRELSPNAVIRQYSNNAIARLFI
jgi:hypothetical protein